MGSDDNSGGACPDPTTVLADSAEIDNRGAFEGTANYRLNETVLDLANCYDQTGDEFAAEVVTRVLLRYADVVQDWPLIDQDGNVPQSINFLEWDLGGLWGGEWIYIDLAKSANLARAFELVEQSPAVDQVGAELGVDARSVIREQLLRYLVDFNLRFGRGGRLGNNTDEALFTFGNMDPFRLQQLYVFGRVVDPAYIHIAVRFLRLFPTIGFFRDGFWQEGTVSYHRQVVHRLNNLATALEGYSDPPGYEHQGYTTLFGDSYPGVPGRFDNLDPWGDAAADFARIKTSENLLTLPDGTMLAMNDTHRDTRNEIEMGDISNVPTESNCLLALRHCVLVSGEGSDVTLLHLDYGGTEGHEHYDALHEDLWADGRMMLGDGTYRGYSPREWNMSTSAHNTVWVDRIDQDSRFDDRVALTEYDRIEGVGNHLWQGYGHGDSENAGQLLAADLAGGPVQYVAADAAKAYNAHISMKNYQRTLVLVQSEEGETYIVDVFYVNGGFLHEWMLHGDLASEAEMETTLDERPSKGALGPYLKIERIAKASGNWRSDIVYPDDGRRLQSFHVNDKNSEVAIARGPAQVREGDANFLVLGKLGPTNSFVVVHVPQDDGSPIENVNGLPAPTGEGDRCIRLKIDFKDGRSDEVAVLKDQSSPGGEGCDGDGSHLTHVASAPGGECLWHYQGDVATSTSAWREGTIEVHRRQDGSPKDGFKIADWPGSDSESMPSLLHLRLPNGGVESYRIRNLERFPDNSVFVEIQGEPGLRIEAKPDAGESAFLVKQLYYPARGFVGPITYRTTTNVTASCK